MKKRLLSAAVLVGLALVLMISGCADRNASYVESESKTNPQLCSESDEVSGNESNKTVEYKSLIEKYVGGVGTSYKAYDYMLGKSVKNEYSAEEWLDSDGMLTLPFVPDDIKETLTSTEFGEYKVLYESTGLASYYVPDELAVKASIGELADIFMSYGYNSGIILSLVSRLDSREFEHEFEYDLSHCNALEESLRRDDFAGEYFERYMAESENMPEYYDDMSEEDFQLYLSGSYKTNTLNMLEVILAQPEACAQLTDEQRLTLVRRVIEKERLGEQGKLFHSNAEYGYRSFFFSCIAGECYLSGESAYISDIKGEIQWQDNPWINAIKEMDLNEDEQKTVDKYFSSGE